MEAGAVFVKLDYVSETYSNTDSGDVDKTIDTAAAGFSFPAQFLIGLWSPSNGF